MYNTKETNPKESVGIKKWRYFSTIPFTVMAEVGMALVEGARKYGRHNYRVTGVKASVYVDASIGHIAQWYEGEDMDAESTLSHITKAIASLVVLRDAMLQDKLIDDRPPKGNLDKVRTEMQAVVEELFEKYPDSVPAFTQKGAEETRNNNKSTKGIAYTTCEATQYSGQMECDHCSMTWDLDRLYPPECPFPERNFKPGIKTILPKKDK